MPLNKALEASLVIIGKSGPVVQFLFRFTEYTNRDRHVNRSKYCQLNNTKIVSKPKHFLSNFQLPSSHKSKKKTTSMTWPRHPGINCAFHQSLRKKHFDNAKKCLICCPLPFGK